MNLGIKDKTILITGGSSGIGYATALEYAKETDCNIAFSYHNAKQQQVNEIINQIESYGCKALAVKMDLADFDSIQTAVKAVVDNFGSIHILVNNAVYWGNWEHRGKSFEEMPISVWQEIVGINLFGTVKVTQSVVPYMRKQKFGRIVNISSDVAIDSMKGSGAYSSLKSALFGFNANLVTELSADNILSNVVIPGWTLTDKARKAFDENIQLHSAKAVPTNRLTVPTDVATLIAYLGSSANGHINGEHIKVSGHSSLPLMSYILQEIKK